jgi:deazaflavin-dependent oxidoreductase (nitroreductase family)
MAPTPPPGAPPGTLRARIWNAFTATHVSLYRASGGRIGRRVSGVPILLLEHVGRKSGQRRTTPLMYVEDGDDLVLVASFGGAPKHPSWWINLRANPETTVQVGGERRPVRAREASPEERGRLWDKAVDAYSDYAVYQTRTDREIPVVVLNRV